MNDFSFDRDYDESLIRVFCRNHRAGLKGGPWAEGIVAGHHMEHMAGKRGKRRAQH